MLRYNFWSVSVLVIPLVLTVVSFPTDDSALSRRKVFETFADTFFGTGFRLFYKLLDKCSNLDAFTCVRKTANTFVNRAKKMDLLSFTSDVYLVRKDNESEPTVKGRQFADDEEVEDNDVESNTSLVLHPTETIEEDDSFLGKLASLFGTHDLEIGLGYIYPGLQLEVSRNKRNKKFVDINFVIKDDASGEKDSSRGKGGFGFGGGKKGIKGMKTIVIAMKAKLATIMVLCYGMTKLMFKKAIVMSKLALILIALVWYKKKSDYDRNIVVDPHDRFYVLTPGDDTPKLAYRGYLSESPLVEY